jgi:thiol-disulfide isomerase/thioredoxin
MTTRWLMAAAAAVGVGVLAVPMLYKHSAAPATDAPAIGSTGGAACKADTHAKLEFTVKDMNGADVHLADYKGKVILLNYWATWCPPCKAEIPDLIDLYTRYKDKGLVILGVSTDDDAPTLREYAKEMKMNYPVLVGRDHDDLLEAFGEVFGLPTSYLIARDGAVCAKQIGPATKAEFESAIKPLL